MVQDMQNQGPLDGVRILAIEQFGAGPFCSLFFADAGAEVIKIEDPGNSGDVGRCVPPVVSGDSSLYFETFNRGKRSIALDLKNPAGRAVFEQLVSGADAVFNNLRGDQPARLGLTYADLSHLNPRIVCASLSAYGRTGERAAEPGYDALIQAETGWAALTGEPGGPPIKSGLSLVDYAAGSTIAFGLIAAIFQAQRTGRGCDVDTSLFDVALSLLSYPATWFLSAGIHPDRLPSSAHPSIVPFQFFETKDGHIAVACAKEKFFNRLVVLMDLAELAGDSRFANFSARHEHRDELLQRLESRFRAESSAIWLDRLRGKVPCAPVQNVEEALDPETLRGRGLLSEYEHHGLGIVRTVGSPIAFSGFEAVYRSAPPLDGDRFSLLIELGMTDSEIASLEAAGAFGRRYVPDESSA